MPPLLITIPVATSDLTLVEALSRQLNHLGPPPQHAVLLVADHDLSADAAHRIESLAKPVFPHGGLLIRTPFAITPAYPHAHNLRFETAAKRIASEERTPWLWLDPRCVPTRRGWIVELEREYFTAKKPFMGARLTPESHSTAAPLISSTAIYPVTLPKRMFQRLVAQRGLDFEKSCADLVVPEAHPTTLIWIHALDGTPALPTPPDRAALVHTAKALAFAAKVRGEPVQSESHAIDAPHKAAIANLDKIVEAALAPAEPRAAYYHSGDLGDIIYALAAIRLAGGGKLLLGPRLKNTPPPANPVREDQFGRFAPLLRAQPYLTRVDYIDRYPGTDSAFDLNIFREQWCDKGLRERTSIRTLAEQHCHTLGVRERFRPEAAWLTIPSPITTNLFAVHRSPRYRNEAFPWPLIVKRYAGRLLFVGLASEHAEFQRTFSTRTAFWLCQDFLELARVIAGSLGFIGNQSFPNALALAMGQRVLQESWATSPDCVLLRPSFLTQPFVEKVLDKWEESPRTFIESFKLITEPLAIEGKSIKPDIIVPATPVAEVVDQPRRHVLRKLIHGLYELGPQENAFGLGDTLTITPLAARLGKRAVMCLPPSLSRFAPLFDGLCPVRITDNYPVFPNPGGERFIESKLRLFGFKCVDGETLPVVRLRDDELLPNEPGTVMLHTECKQEWAHIRSRPDEWWRPVLASAAKFTCHRFSQDISLRRLAAQCKATGLYLGTNSGPWHLAMAVGCKCLVIDADACDGYNPALWRYNLPKQCEYVGFDTANIIAKLPWLLAP